MKLACLSCGRKDIWIQRPRVICNDGISLSIQAGNTLYSTPSEQVDHYTHVEVGFIENQDHKPFNPGDEWSDYADDSMPSDVYGYVPVELVEKFIAEHGGRKFFT